MRIAKTAAVIAVFALAGSLSACASKTDNTVGGAVAGGTAGAVVGGPVGAVLGAGVGAVAGSRVRPTRRYVREPIIQ